MKEISLATLDRLLDMAPGNVPQLCWIPDNYPFVSFPGVAFWAIPGVRARRTKAALKELVKGEG